MWTMDNAGNISTTAEVSITYDKTPPVFDTYNSKSILLQATNAYTYSIINSSDNVSGVRDYGIMWTE